MVALNIINYLIKIIKLSNNSYSKLITNLQDNYRIVEHNPLYIYP
jgi:hypothetical protein